MLMPSSEKWGSGYWDYGRYPVKVYTIDGVLIYQTDSGDDNTVKTPKGGVLYQSSPASSMLDVIANPITFYTNPVINQVGHSKDLYDYYWTSYSRGVDGRTNNHPDYEPNWHNAYLDGYIPLRVKSIYDPCPYLYRIPSNGTYNQFEFNQGWTMWSYLGGVSWNMNALGESWFISGWRGYGSCNFVDTGRWGLYYAGISVNMITGYTFTFNSMKTIQPNRNDLPRSHGFPVRCIDFATLAFLLRTSA